MVILFLAFLRAYQEIRKMKNRYKEIESSIYCLIGNSAPLFHESEFQEIVEYIEVGEYGLALETYIDICIEEQKKIPFELIEKCVEIARMMEMSIQDKISTLRKR